MNRWAKALLTVAMCGAGTVFPLQAKALRVAMPRLDPVQGVLQADVVVTGKVKEIEKNSVEAAQFAGPNAAKIKYTVAVIDIKDAVQGAGNLTQVRVGFPAGVAGPDAPALEEGVKPFRRPPFRGGGMEAQPLVVGQEGCFFLQKHPSGDFYVSVPYCLPLDAKAENYKEQLLRVSDTVAVFKDPVKALKVEDKKKRYANLQTLVQCYQTYRPDPVNPAQPRRVDVPAEESKIIMQMIADLPATNPDPEVGHTVQSFFGFLQAQPADGWTQPKFMNQPDYQKIYAEAAQAWVKENAGKFRVKRFESK